MVNIETLKRLTLKGPLRHQAHSAASKATVCVSLGLLGQMRVSGEQEIDWRVAHEPSYPLRKLRYDIPFITA